MPSALPRGASRVGSAHTVGTNPEKRIHGEFSGKRRVRINPFERFRKQSTVTNHPRPAIVRRL